MLSHTLLKPAAVDGQAVAVEALGFLAGEPDLMRRFLDVTGIEADDIRAAAQPGRDVDGTGESVGTFNLPALVFGFSTPLWSI